MSCQWCDYIGARCHACSMESMDAQLDSVNDPWLDDPTGTAAKITAGITGVLSLVLAVVGLFNGDVQAVALTAAIGTAVSGVVGVVALLKARTRAYAPTTVTKISHESFELGVETGKAEARPT